MKIVPRMGLTFDDVQIIPEYSEVVNRNNCCLKTKLSKRYGLVIPIVSSPMDTVTESKMAIEMIKLGGCGIIHRFMSIDKQVKEVVKTSTFITEDIWESWGIPHDDWHTEIKQIPIAFAVGVIDDYIDRATRCVTAGANIVCIDVAHGNTLLVKNAIKELRIKLPIHVDIIAGNVATRNGARNLCTWGIDGIRVGIGNGSLCTSRIKTGVGIPQISALIDCSDVADEYDAPIISDGGMKTPGDVAKAMAAGASTVMLGSLLSGTKESPGEVLKDGAWPNERLYKKYRGSASLDSKLAHNLDGKNVEGQSAMVLYKGKTKRIITDIEFGIKSSMSYVGVTTVDEFIMKSVFQQVTQNGYIEAQPHLLKE